MFRRKSFLRPRRRFFRRRFHRRPRLARSRFDRVVLFNNLQGDFTQGATIYTGAGGTGGQILPCGPIILTHCNSAGGACATCESPPCELPECCSQLVTLRLLSNDQLESTFNDQVTVVSIFGDLWYRTEVLLQNIGRPCSSASAEAFPNLQEYVSRYAEQWSLGLMKFNQAQQPFDRDAAADIPVNFFNLTTPLFSYDWTENRWLWQRARFFQPVETAQDFWITEGSKIGCVGNTSGGDSENDLSEGTGIINTHITTSIQNCTVDATESCTSWQQRSFSARLPPMHHTRLAIRRHITLRADDNLDLQIAVRHPTRVPVSGAGWGCNEPAFSHEAGSTNYQIFARIGAVLRLS